MSDAEAARLRAWLDVRAPLERQLAPIGEAVLDRLGLRGGERVIDIGCGIARTPERIAGLVGPGGKVTAIDVMAAAIKLRRAETASAANIDFVTGDAQRFGFAPAGHDAAFSRFGTMFFADLVAAFANIGRALRVGGRLAFVCWRTLGENDLDGVPLAAAAPLLPAGSVAEAAAAEHFSFADPDYLRGLLEEAGYRAITVERCDVPVSCGDRAASVAVLSRFGSLGEILRDRPELRAAATERLDAALASRGDDPVLTAGTWIVRATR